MNTKEAKQSVQMDKALFDFYGKPSIGQSLPLAIQHVLAMIVGCVTPSIIVAGVAGLSQEDSVILIQAALVMSALTTLIQLFPFVKTKWFTIGAGLPVMMGISFAYVPSMQAIAADFDIATILGAQIVGGIIALLVGLNIKRIRKFFPPLITGTVVFSIGLSLYPTAINYMAGGASSENYGSWKNWLVAIITLIIVTTLNHFGKGIWKLASILIGIIGGYIVALCFGMVDFSSVAQAAIFQLPKPMHFGIKFEPSSCVALGILFAINSVQAIGDFSATTTGSMDRMPTDTELSGGVICDGIGSSFAALLGVLPNTSFSQNVGLVTMTKIVNRFALGCGAVFLILCGLLPKLAALVSIMPQCVLGGAAVIMFSSIVMSGIQLITKEPLTARNMTIVSVALGLGYGIGANSAILAGLPDFVALIFGGSGIVPAAFVAIILNILLPKEEA